MPYTVHFVDITLASPVRRTLCTPAASLFPLPSRR